MNELRATLQLQLQLTHAKATVGLMPEQAVTRTSSQQLRRSQQTWANLKVSHLRAIFFLSSKQVLQVDDVGVKATGRGGYKRGSPGGGGGKKRCNCFIPRPVKPSGVWRMLAQRVPPNACIVVVPEAKPWGLSTLP